MSKYLFNTLLFLYLNQVGFAETNSYDNDVNAIKNLCGCFEVDFKYKETFSPNKKYKLKDTYVNEALEWVSYEPQTDGSIQMQHILILDESSIVKHWREEWSFENSTIYTYNKDYHWKSTPLKSENIKNTWTQKVFEVDDRPQYDGVATFTYFDGKTLWQSNSDAPLPRREYSTRSDYNVLNRLNRLYISDTGYLHEQDNKKITRQAAAIDTLITEEKGYNMYRKVDENKCKAGIDWWNINKLFWLDVRAVWNEILPSQTELKVNRIVEGKTLHDKLFAMNLLLINDKKYNSEKAKKEIRKTITEHLVTK